MGSKGGREHVIKIEELLYKKELNNQCVVFKANQRIALQVAKAQVIHSVGYEKLFLPHS